MKNTSIFAAFFSVMLLVMACSQEAELPKRGEHKKSVIDNARSLSKEELEIWLQDRYGELQPGFAIWATSGEGIRGPFVYKLTDGRIIEIDGYATKELKYFVDPSFDLSSLPEGTQ